MLFRLRYAWRNDSWLLDLAMVFPIALAITLYGLRGGLLLTTSAELLRLFYVTLAAVFASLLGFNVTSASILALASSAPALMKLRRERPQIYRRLIDTFRVTIIAAICAVVIPLAALLGPVSSFTVAVFGLFLSLISALYAVVRLCRSVGRLFAILSV